MTKLYISLNNIRTINNHTFVNLISLTHLLLYNNSIEFIEYDAFININKLKRLNINNNKLIQININILKIDTYHNRSIQLIEINENKLLIIKSFSFEYKSIESLYLSHNKIKSIEKNAFKNTQIVNLFLKNNKLITIREHVFSNVKIIVHLGRNKIQCNCDLIWIINNEKMKKILNHKYNEKTKCSNKQSILVHINNMECPNHVKRCKQGKLYIFYLIIYNNVLSNMYN